jgi:hypothetical protein
MPASADDRRRATRSDITAAVPWFAPLDAITAAGATTEPGGLAGLAAARAKHQGQFFTPHALSLAIWRSLGTATHRSAHAYSRLVTVLDPACGSGRLFIGASPDHHHLFGIDIDGDCTQRVHAAACAGGFTADITQGDSSAYHFEHVDVAVLNPPFSLHWDHPQIQPLPINSYGRHGARSSAISHWYLLWQAVEAAGVVAAILPAAAGDRLLRDPTLESTPLARRLHALVTLPADTFKSEGADWLTCLAIYQPRSRPAGTEPIILSIDHLDALPTWDLPAPDRWCQTPVIRPVACDVTTPVITEAVTGDLSVRLVKDGRHIGLRFACGATKARVLNAILIEPLHACGRSNPRPAGVRYQGQGILDLENHLVQPDPVASFQSLVDRLAAWGFTPHADPAIAGYLARKARQNARRSAPLGHTVYCPENDLTEALTSLEPGATVRGVCTAPWSIWSSWYGSTDRTVTPGESVVFTRNATSTQASKPRRGRTPRQGETDAVSFCYLHGNCHATIGLSAAIAHFTFPDLGNAAGWKEIHPPLQAVFPEQGIWWRARALRCGIDRILNRSYQFEDAIEFKIRGSSICGWDMGLGKARLGLSLCLLGGARNLVVVEARLLEEMATECRAIGLPADQWQIITDHRQARTLRRVNLVAYSRLRAPAGRGAIPKDLPNREQVVTSVGRRTIARLLRHRIHTLVADEAHLMRNGESNQAQAIAAICPKVIYDLSGTPIANYPRDVLPLLQHVAGDGTAVQPFGDRFAYLEANNVQTMSAARRGHDVFREMFMVTEWVTNEFADNLRGGAKREIPRINDVRGFRSAVAPHIKRRIAAEPAVAATITIPVPTYTTTVVPWDAAHFDHYHTVVQEFAHWFKALPQYEKRGRTGLIQILAKIGAIHRAANIPQLASQTHAPYPDLTSKQRWSIDRLVALAATGHRTLAFGHSPALLTLIADGLRSRGIEPVLFHGAIPMARRIAALDEHFRNGTAPVVLGSVMCLQKGYNLWQADRVLFLDRSWTNTEEEQAAARVLRPQQTRPVTIEYLHLPGSIDEYQAQMVSHKAHAHRAGLDYGSDDPEQEFLHLETILARFIADAESARSPAITKKVA